MATSEINDLTAKIRRFNNERNWEQFHNPKDLAISLSLEASEVLEHFLWKTPSETQKHLLDHKTEVADELADVFYNVLLMCEYAGIDLIAATHAKMAKNALKYPVEKSKGTHAKHTELA